MQCESVYKLVHTSIKQILEYILQPLKIFIVLFYSTASLFFF